MLPNLDNARKGQPGRRQRRVSRVGKWKVQGEEGVAGVSISQERQEEARRRPRDGRFAPL
jgi:hypothetical protein